MSTRGSLCKSLHDFHNKMLGRKKNKDSPPAAPLPPPPPRPSRLQWGCCGPWQPCHLLPAELEPNYSQLINLKPIRIFPSTCTRSQGPDRDGSEVACSGHSAGWGSRWPPQGALGGARIVPGGGRRVSNARLPLVPSLRFCPKQKGPLELPAPMPRGEKALPSSGEADPPVGPAHRLPSSTRAPADSGESET